MTPAEAIDRAAQALDLARGDDAPEAIAALHRALVDLAAAFEVTSPTDPRTVATRAAIDAAVAARTEPHRAAIDAAQHAVMAARAALKVPA